METTIATNVTKERKQLTINNNEHGQIERLRKATYIKALMHWVLIKPRLRRRR